MTKMNLTMTKEEEKHLIENDAAKTRDFSINRYTLDVTSAKDFTQEQIWFLERLYNTPATMLHKNEYEIAVFAHSIKGAKDIIRNRVIDIKSVYDAPYDVDMGKDDNGVIHAKLVNNLEQWQKNIEKFMKRVQDRHVPEERA